MPWTGREDDPYEANEWEPEEYEQEDHHFLEEDEYEAFAAREFGADGRIRGVPPVGVLVILVIAILLLLTFVWTR